MNRVFPVLVMLSLFSAFCAPGMAADASSSPESRNVTREGKDKFKRVALVIGNGAYENISKLKNSRQDATAMAATFRSMGFEVIEKPDAGQREMKAAVRELESRLNKNSIGVLYYAGHGMQVKGNNYLLPVDIPFPENERQLEDESIEMHQLLLNISKAAKFTMFIVDACRDKPVNFKDTRDAGTPGLAKPDAVPDGVVVLYSAGAGQKALDNLGRNDTNPNGLFTRELLKQIKTPGLPVNELAQNVYERVKEQAARIGHEQTPGYYGQSGRFALVGGGLTSSSAPNTSATASALEVEIEFWRVAEKANTKVAYESYLQKYPSGQFVSLARAGIESVSRIQAPSASVSNNDSGGRSSNDDPSLVRLLYQIEDEAKRLRADQLDSLRRSAERGDPYAATLLGAWHENNDNPSVLLAGRSASIRWYRRAADKDYLPAMFMLAYAYQVGWVSGSADPSTAHKYYAAAEKRGYAPAQWGLARLIAANQPQAAVALLNKSAEQGYDKAMADLAFAYLKGIGTAPDPKSAEKWARAAYDEQQNEKAQHILGYLYWRKLIKARGETDELRLASFARLREAGGFAFGVE